MAQKFYMTIKGTKQGTIKGGSTRHQDWTEVISFSFDVKAPVDAGTGQATGRRQHKPVIIVRETDSASPLLYQALVSNETLKSVSLSFARPNGSGNEEVYQTIELTNATIVKYKTFAGHEEVTVNFENSSANSGPYRRLQHEIFFSRLL